MDSEVNKVEMKKPKVVILYKYIPQYRRLFYELLRERLNSLGIELSVIYGQPGLKDAKLMDAIDLPWGQSVHNTYLNFGERELCWQPALQLLQDSDLVIVEMANKLLVNYILLLQNAFGARRVAFWGHGRNFQAKKEHRFSESIKRILSTKAYWWFAYNNLSAEVVHKLGYPMARITVVQNAIDTSQLKNELEKLTLEDIEQTRREIGLSGEHIGLYVGGMYPDKRLKFLLDSLIYIRGQIPDFEMIFIGSGSDAYLIQEMNQNNSWIHFLGPKFDNEKVPYFALSKLFLMPGLTGLAILDCFALGVPLITTKYEGHSPEIEYLKAGENGVMVDPPDDPRLFAQGVVDLFRDEGARLKLVEGCRASSSKFSIEKMVENFANGVNLALIN
jgi:glycosyltransferase involved in cell wall biosynthesis